MENVIRKLSLALVVALCVVCLIGCGKKKPKEETGEETSTPGTGVIFQDNGTYTEKYVLTRPEGSKQPLHIYDVETGLLSIYCFDPGCEHKPEKRSLDGETVLEKGCPAYDYITYPVYIKENTMYFFHDNCLWSADVTGQNRKEITRIKRPVYTSNALYTDEALYLTYTTPYEWILHEENGTSEWIAGEMKEKQEAGVLRIPYSGEGEQQQDPNDVEQQNNTNAEYSNVIEESDLHLKLLNEAFKPGMSYDDFVANNKGIGYVCAHCYGIEGLMQQGFSREYAAKNDANYNDGRGWC